MRDGYKVFDCDTHVTPMAETLDPYLGPELRARVPDLEQRKVEFKTGWAGEKLEPPYRHTYRMRGGGRRDQALVGFDLGRGCAAAPAAGLPARPPGPRARLAGCGRCRADYRPSQLCIWIPRVSRPVGQPVPGPAWLSPVGCHASR